jgi:tRNA-Thr(GGU) m(6)t(6)A37 methyltransferase TsaA
MELISVGWVHSPVSTRKEMPLQGVRGLIEIYPDYVPALDGIESNSHLVLLCWMHQGDRRVLQARARKIAQDSPLKGVFALRSPSRPNPISLSVVQLLQRSGDAILEVDLLDLIDGTPVLDIKPYQPAWDCIFSAKTHDRSEKIRKMGQARFRETLTREAVGYHGEWCPGAAIAVRIAEEATHVFGDLRKEDISVIPGRDPCIIDGLIGITGARPGNGRLLFPQIGKGPLHNDTLIIITGPEETITFMLLPDPGGPDEILGKNGEKLFEVKTGAW